MVLLLWMVFGVSIRLDHNGWLGWQLVQFTLGLILLQWNLLCPVILEAPSVDHQPLNLSVKLLKS
jgi:hypothetical protein